MPYGTGMQKKLLSKRRLRRCKPVRTKSATRTTTFRMTKVVLRVIHLKPVAEQIIYQFVRINRGWTTFLELLHVGISKIFYPALPAKK